MEQREIKILDEELIWLRAFIFKFKELDKISRSNHNVSSRMLELTLTIDKLSIISKERKALKEELTFLNSLISQVNVKEEKEKIVEEIRSKYETKYQEEGITPLLEELNIEGCIYVLERMYKTKYDILQSTMRVKNSKMIIKQ